MFLDLILDYFLVKQVVLFFSFIILHIQEVVFMKDMQKARDKGAYSDADYNAMSEAYEYGLSVI